MEVVIGRAALVCGLDEFFAEHWKAQPDVTETLDEVREELMGKSEIKPRFRISTPDGKSDIFFNSRELLCRFANMPTITQCRFVKAIRMAMRANDVTVLKITIPWSRNGMKILEVHGAPDVYVSLDFELR